MKLRTRTAIGLAGTVVAVHLVVLALFTQGLAAAIAAGAWIAALPFLVRACTEGGRFVRAASAGLPGLVVTAAGVVTHIGRTVLNGPSATDVTGIAMALPGLALIVMALSALFAGTRRRTKLLWIPLAFVLLQFYALPVLLTGSVATNTHRFEGPAAASLGIAGAEDVGFTASDGVALRGWFVPGRRMSAIVLLHGSHGTRNSTFPYLRFLHAAEYGVLAYDARGHGASDGNENAAGWNGDRDLAGAVSYLRGRGIQRIGALGLSMGGEEACERPRTGFSLPP